MQYSVNIRRIGGIDHKIISVQIINLKMKMGVMLLVFLVTIQ